VRGPVRVAAALAAAACCTAALAQAGAGVAQPAEGTPRSAAAVIDPRVDNASTSTVRLALLGAAESALARGDSVSAIADFESAAMMLHSADTEMGLVRAYLQQGDYRKALAFAAHAAGAHRDTPAAAALYAWLLSVGGQGAFAQRVLDEALARSPQDAVLNDTRRRLAASGAVTPALLLATPHRMAPQAVMQAGEPAPPPNAQVVASGVLLGDGRHVLLPLGAVVDERAPLWVRDGLGRTAVARVERRIESLGLVLATLGVGMSAGAAPAASRDPFAGSTGYVIAHAPAGDAAPAWPWLHAGFVGASTPGARRLGVDVPATVHGAPLFDAAGRWAGIAMKGPDGPHELIAIQRLRDELGDLLGAGSAPEPTARMTPDVVYERGLRVALQVIVAAPAH